MCKKCVTYTPLHKGLYMLYNKTIAAKLAGVSRKTFYNHIHEKNISITKDDDGTDKIELSELERVYGLEKVAQNRKKIEDNDVKETPSDTPQTTQQVTPSHSEIRIREQALEIEKINEVFEVKKRALEDKIDLLEETLRDTKSQAKTYQGLLENYAEQKSGAGGLEKKLHAMEQRLANQEQVQKEVLKAKEESDRKLRQYRGALKAEKEKGFFKKLFG